LWFIGLFHQNYFGARTAPYLTRGIVDIRWVSLCGQQPQVNALQGEMSNGDAEKFASVAGTKLAWPAGVQKQVGMVAIAGGSMPCVCAACTLVFLETVKACSQSPRFLPVYPAFALTL
jgi:hypothetical protein